MRTKKKKATELKRVFPRDPFASKRRVAAAVPAVDEVVPEAPEAVASESAPESDEVTVSTTEA